MKDLKPQVPGGVVTPQVTQPACETQCSSVAHGQRWCRCTPPQETSFLVSNEATAFWLDVSAVVPGGEGDESMKVVSASHTEHRAIRTAVVSDHYNVRGACRVRR